MRRTSPTAPDDCYPVGWRRQVSVEAQEPATDIALDVGLATNASPAQTNRLPLSMHTAWDEYPSVTARHRA